MEARLNLWIIIFMAAAAQGLFLFVLLLIKRAKKSKVQHNLLATLILAFTITIAYYITFWTGVNTQLPNELRLIFQLSFLFGPLAYLYLKHLLDGSLPKHYWLHFIPFICFSILMFLPLNQGRFLIHYPLPGFPHSLHLMIYGMLCLVLSFKYRENTWVRNVALSFNGYVLCFFSYYLLEWTDLLRLEYDYIVSLGSAVFIYFIGYHGFKDPLSVSEKRPEEKYQKSSLTNEALASIASKLDAIMYLEELFTNGDLKLNDVAKRLELTPHALSQAINVSKAKKFTDYLNELRIEKAIALMHSPEYQDAKLLAVGIDSGFNNKTSFLNAFKKVTGQSPSDYRKSILSKAS